MAAAEESENEPRTLFPRDTAATEQPVIIVNSAVKSKFVRFRQIFLGLGVFSIISGVMCMGLQIPLAVMRIACQVGIWYGIFLIVVGLLALAFTIRPTLWWLIIPMNVLSIVVTVFLIPFLAYNAKCLITHHAPRSLTFTDVLPWSSGWMEFGDDEWIEGWHNWDEWKDENMSEITVYILVIVFGCLGALSNFILFVLSSYTICCKSNNSPEADTGPLINMAPSTSAYRYYS